MQIPGVHIETIHNPRRDTYAQIDRACAIAQRLGRGKLVLVEPAGSQRVLRLQRTPVGESSRMTPCAANWSRTRSASANRLLAPVLLALLD
jgi:hypothetical protein